MFDLVWIQFNDISDWAFGINWASSEIVKNKFKTQSKF